MSSITEIRKVFDRNVNTVCSNYCESTRVLATLLDAAANEDSLLRTVDDYFEWDELLSMLCRLHDATHHVKTPFGEMNSDCIWALTALGEATARVFDAREEQSRSGKLIVEFFQKARAADPTSESLDDAFTGFLPEEAALVAFKGSWYYPGGILPLLELSSDVYLIPTFWANAKHLEMLPLPQKEASTGFSRHLSSVYQLLGNASEFVVIDREFTVSELEVMRTLLRDGWEHKDAMRAAFALV